MYNFLIPVDTIREIHTERRISKMLFSPSEKGQGLVEYALILILVAIVVIAALNYLAPVIGDMFSTIGNTLQTSS